MQRHIVFLNRVYLATKNQWPFAKAYAEHAPAPFAVGGVRGKTHEDVVDIVAEKIVPSLKNRLSVNDKFVTTGIDVSSSHQTTTIHVNLAENLIESEVVKKHMARMVQVATNAPLDPRKIYFEPCNKSNDVIGFSLFGTPSGDLVATPVRSNAVIVNLSGKRIPTEKASFQSVRKLNAGLFL